MPTEWTPERIEAEALRRYPEDFRTIGGSAMERRAFQTGASWGADEVRGLLDARIEELRAYIDRMSYPSDVDDVSRRAEAAEAKVRAGLAVVAQIEAMPVPQDPGMSQTAITERIVATIARTLRAALADPTPEPIWLGPGVDNPPERP